MNESLTLTPRVLLGLAAAVATVVGALGPWRTIGALSASGTTISDDAKLIVAGGIVAGVLILLDRASVAVLLIGLAALGLALNAISGVTAVEILGIKARAGWGLILAIAGGAGLVAWAAVDLRALRPERRTPRQP